MKIPNYIMCCPYCNKEVTYFSITSSLFKFDNYCKFHHTEICFQVSRDFQNEDLDKTGMLYKLDSMKIFIDRHNYFYVTTKHSPTLIIHEDKLKYFIEIKLDYNWLSLLPDQIVTRAKKLMVFL